VTVGWMPCDCKNALSNGVLGHLWVRCRTSGCSSIWYRPRHEQANADLACHRASASARGLRLATLRCRPTPVRARWHLAPRRFPS